MIPGGRLVCQMWHKSDHEARSLFEPMLPTLRRPSLRPHLPACWCNHAGILRTMKTADLAKQRSPLTRLYRPPIPNPDSDREFQLHLDF